MKNMIVIAFLIVACSPYPLKAQTPQILPEPVSIRSGQGVFQLTPAMTVFVEGGSQETANAIQLLLGNKIKADSTGCRIFIRVSADLIHASASPEAYALDISPDRISISANAAAGVFYALQSLVQLGKSRIPAVHILDYPRYAWRGMHLDVSRHFFSVAFIKEYLDILARYKINTFHWHLTDSHGWRLEIKQYPRLTSVGGWRADRAGIPMTIAEPTQPGEKADYGGFYTQEQIKDILAYAAARFITVIPEIEMPGHCTAALVAYPQFADLGNPTPLLMPTGYGGDLMHNFCAGYDSTFIFLQNILRETMALFPSPWIHIGGDEVRDGPWLTCPRCQRRMKELGLKNPRQLQAWFTGRIDSFVTASGRRMIGWDEVRNASMAPGSAVMSWHGDPNGRDSAGTDHDVVMTPYRYTYFDFYQSDPRLEPDITYAPLFLDSVYAFDPGAGSHTLGGEACLWTENVPTPKRVEYMLLPRLLALSEAVWTPKEKKDYARFITGVQKQQQFLDAAGIVYAKSMYNPGIHPVFDSASHSVIVTLSKQIPSGVIRYTLDGTKPGPRSPIYKAPLRLQKSAILATAVGPSGKILVDTFRIHHAIGAPLVIAPALDAEGMDAVNRLVDGIRGTVEPYDGRWVPFHDSSITIRIDLGRQTPISRISLHCMEDQVSNIYLPRKIVITTSTDGTTFLPLADFSNPKTPKSLLRHTDSFTKNASAVIARYVKIRFDNASLWKDPMKNQIFIDEIAVD